MIAKQKDTLSSSIAKYMRSLLKLNNHAGSTFSEVLPNCTSNSYLYLDFGCKETLGVDVHIDTVGSDEKQRPFDSDIKNGRLYGLGSVDTKASIALVLTLVQAGLRKGMTFRHNICIAATNDEEYGSTGAPTFAAWLENQDFRINKLLVAEPTNCTPGISHQGLAKFVLKAKAKQPPKAHQSLVNFDESAQGRALLLIQALIEPALILQNSPKSGSMTFSPIVESTGANTAGANAGYTIMRRLSEGENTENIANVLNFKIKEAAKRYDIPEDSFDLELVKFYESVNWEKGSLAKEIELITSMPAQALPFGTNAWAYSPINAFLSTRDICDELVIFGPGSIEQAHQKDEYVEISELELAFKVYSQLFFE